MRVVMLPSMASRDIDAPAAYYGIKREDEEHRKDADAAEDPPRFAGSPIKASHRTAAAGSAHCEFCEQQRHATVSVKKM